MLDEPYISPERESFDDWIENTPMTEILGDNADCLLWEAWLGEDIRKDIQNAVNREWERKKKQWEEI